MPIRLLTVIIVLFSFIMAAGPLCYGNNRASSNENPGTTAGSDGYKSDMILAQITPKDAPVSTAAPEILIPENSFDFGNVAQAAKLSHKFVIKNVGAAPLKLISAKGS